jgi:hypothetical protein
MNNKIPLAKKPFGMTMPIEIEYSNATPIPSSRAFREGSYFYLRLIDHN